MGLIVAPYVVAALDNSADTSIYYSFTEEENIESKSIIFPFSTLSYEFELSDFNDFQSFGYQFKNYAKPYINLVFSPPEQYPLC